jgi:hypothetical protein
MKSINFRGKTYCMGKEIPKNTKIYSGFFFHKYIEYDTNQIQWYFVRIEKDWLYENKWIEYYSELYKYMHKFEDSIESESTFYYENKNSKYNIVYYEAYALKDTLKKL